MTQAELKKQMDKARREMIKAADAIVDAFKEKFGTNVLPDHIVIDDEVQWDIDWTDEDSEEHKQILFLEECGLFPIDCHWLWG